jgi:hypothetical protein
MSDESDPPEVESLEWFSDDPSPNAAGELGRQPFLDRVESTLDRAHRVEGSTVFGLVGPWGSGKSSVVKWLGERLTRDDQDDPWMVVNFNPWTFQDVISLQLGFFRELRSAIGGFSKGEKARAALAEFGDQVAPFVALATSVVPNADDAVRGVSSLLRGDKSAESSRRKLEKALRDLDQPILVVMDDLDRLTADELLMTLKLVRLVGRLPNVHYLLCYDEETILGVLTNTSLIGKRATARARDYLEKVVQIRMDVPPLRPSDVQALVNEGLSELASQGLNMDRTTASRFSGVYFEVLQYRLSTPRAVKRFFAQVRNFFGDLDQEVDASDFLILTWLRTAEPGVYQLIQRRRSDLLGSARELRFDRRDKEQLLSEWRRELGSSGIRDRDVSGVETVLAELFPRYADIREGRTPSGGRSEPLRVANGDYFDRYFSFGVPEGDVPDSVVRRAIDDVYQQANHVPVTVATVKVKLALIANPGLVADKVIRELGRDGRNSTATALWVAEIHEALPPDRDILDPHHRVESVLAELMRQMGTEVLLETLAALGVNHGALMIRAVERATRDVSKGSSAALVLRSQALRLFRQVASTTLGQMHANVDVPRGDLTELIWPWMRVDAEGFKDWLSSLDLPLAESASLLVPTTYALGVFPRPYRVQAPTISDLVQFVDVEQLREELKIETADAARFDDFDGPLDSPEARRQALAVALGLSDGDVGDGANEE